MPARTGVRVLRRRGRRCVSPGGRTGWRCKGSSWAGWQVGVGESHKMKVRVEVRRKVTAAGGGPGLRFGAGNGASRLRQRSAAETAGALAQEKLLDTAEGVQLRLFTFNVTHGDSGTRAPHLSHPGGTIMTNASDPSASDPTTSNPTTSDLSEPTTSQPSPTDNAPSGPSFPFATLIVRPWEDPLIEKLGHDPRSPYVERYWTSILGPSATLLLRRLATGLEISPDGFELDTVAWAQELGLGIRGGKNGPFWRSLDRTARFGAAQRNGATLVVRRKLPPLNLRQIDRLPPHLQQAHQAWATRQLIRPGTTPTPASSTPASNTDEAA